ncbi:MAG TPA: diaminopimelate epimerase [Beijerinckiaceae bacterium]|nr:diaminopimelate epimerase [Beijerinckiaceae bacterium]
MIDFVKMNGLGNDFVVIDARRNPMPLGPKQVTLIADRRFGVGCDQLIVLEPSARAQAFMRIFNPDSSEVHACGNATRCIGDYLMAESGADRVWIETGAGLLAAWRSEGGVTVDMGPARLEAAAIPLARTDVDTRRVPIDVDGLGAGLPDWFGAVSMGNPHAVFFVEDVNAHQLERVGPVLETHPLFPQRANVSLVAVAGSDRLIQRVWERGAGLTLACGSGACAAAVAAHRLGLCGRQVEVTLPGGTLAIDWRPEGSVWMSGGTARAFTGRIDPALLEG